MLQNFRGGAGSGYVRVVLNKSEDPGSNPVIRNSYIKHLFTINCIGHFVLKWIEQSMPIGYSEKYVNNG